MDYPAQLVEAGRQMLHKGLTVETWGNLSLRDMVSGLVYVTPSAMPYDAIAPEDVVVLDLAGNRVAGCRKPTVEVEMHLGIYRKRPDVQAVVHTHPIYSLVFAALSRPIPPILDEAAQTLGGTVLVTPYALPGTANLARYAVEALGETGMACLLARHGAVCVGSSMEQAFKVCTVLEMTARVYQMALAIGEPQPLADDLVAYMRDFAQNHYGQDKN